MRLRLPSRTAHALRVARGAVTPPRDVPPHIPRPRGPYRYPSLWSFAPAPVAGPPENGPPEVKGAAEIAGMRAAGTLARRVLDAAAAAVKPGVTTDAIDAVVHAAIVAAGAYPSPLHYRGFPKSVCTSVNDVLCHGIPDLRPLEPGDIVNVDVTVFSEGFHGDVSETYAVGHVDDASSALIATTREALDSAIAACGPGVPLQRVAEIISELAGRRGFSVSPAFCGHGIGRFFHMAPQIVHSDMFEQEGVMREGMTFTVEPILLAGRWEHRILSDQWTAVSVDGSRSAQFEHTIAITGDGAEVLTRKGDVT